MTIIRTTLVLSISLLVSGCGFSRMTDRGTSELIRPTLVPTSQQPRVSKSSSSRFNAKTSAAKPLVAKQVSYVQEESSSEEAPGYQAGLNEPTLVAAESDSDSNSPDSGMIISPAIDSSTLNPAQQYPIDLPTALQLAGAGNWNVRIARERINEASARYQQAKVMWLPSLNFGIGYNHHEGEIQATSGEVSSVSRNSLFIGGGPVTSGAPLAGGSGGPARMAIDLSLADAILEPLSRCQLVKAAQHNADAVFNSVQYQAGAGYYELVRSNLQKQASALDLAETERVLQIIEDFVDAGKGASADVSRMRVIQQNRKQTLVGIEGQIGVASSKLANVLQLDPTKLAAGTLLQPLDQTATPVSLAGTGDDLNWLVEQAIQNRPELRQAQHQVASVDNQLLAEQARPLLPNIHVSGSGGVFGGGPGDNLSKLDGRGDFDVILAWQVENLGAGNRARSRERASQSRSAQMRVAQVREAIANQVSQAHYQLKASTQQMNLASENLANAQDAMEKTLDRIKGQEGNPLELIQSLDAMSAARRALIDAVTNHNIAQLKVLQSTGMPIQ